MKGSLLLYNLKLHSLIFFLWFKQLTDYIYTDIYCKLSKCIGQTRVRMNIILVSTTIDMNVHSAVTDVCPSSAWWQFMTISHAPLPVSHNSLPVPPRVGGWVSEWRVMCVAARRTVVSGWRRRLLRREGRCVGASAARRSRHALAAGRRVESVTRVQRIGDRQSAYRTGSTAAPAYGSSSSSRGGHDAVVICRFHTVHLQQQRHATAAHCPRSKLVNSCDSAV